MARSFGAEALGADGFAVRGPVSAAPAVGCALVELGSNQLGWTASPVAIAGDLAALLPKAGGTMTGPLIVAPSGTGQPIETHSGYALGIDLYTHADAGFRAPYINYYKSRGSQGLPTAVTLTAYEQDSIGGINFGGYDGSQYFPGAASIFTQVSKNWSPTSHGAFISIYGTRTAAGALPQQIIQFGGCDPTDLNAGGSTDDFNIISYRPISFGGNKAANPIINYALGSLGVPAKFNLKVADDSDYADVAAGALTLSRGLTAGAATFSGNVNLPVGANLSTWERITSNNGFCSPAFGPGFWADTNGVSLKSAAYIGWSSTDAGNTGGIDTKLVRNSAGQLDVRGDNGLRVRNGVNGNWANIQSGSITVNGNIDSYGNINHNGNFYFGSDNAFNIGLASNFRPANIYVGTSLTTPNVGNGSGSGNSRFYFGQNVGVWNGNQTGYVGLEAAWLSNPAGYAQVRSNTGVLFRDLAGSAAVDINAASGGFSGDIFLLTNNKFLRGTDTSAAYRNLIGLDNNNTLDVRNNANGEWIGGTVGAYNVRLRTANSDRFIIDGSGTATLTGTLQLVNNATSIQRPQAGLIALCGDFGIRSRNGVNSAYAPIAGSFTQIENGSASLPAHSFMNALDTGAWLVSATPGSRAYAISTDGVEAVRFGGSGTSRVATFSGTVSSVGSSAGPNTTTAFIGQGTQFATSKVDSDYAFAAFGTRSRLRTELISGDSSDFSIFTYNGSVLTESLRIKGTTQGATFAGTIAQGSNDARWTITATGKRDSQVGNGSGTWQTGYREEYNVAGARCGFFGATPVAQQSIAAAATDAATTQTLANSLRTAFLNLGLGV